MKLKKARLHILIEDLTDPEGVEMRTMTSTLRSETPGLERITTASIIPEGTVLGEEFDQLMTNMLELHKDSLKKKSKKRLAAKKKEVFKKKK